MRHGQVPITVIGLALVPLACGGRANSPHGTSASHVTVEDEDAKYELTGSAFAQMDSSERRLVVFTFHADTEPKPSCDLVTDPTVMKKGGFISLSVSDFGAAPGSYTVEEVGVLLGDSATGLTMLSKTATATSIHVQSVDATSLSADVTSTGGAPRTTAAIKATVCSYRSLPSAGRGAFFEAPPPPEPEQPEPPVISRVDTDGLAGITVGMSVAKLPKGVKEQPPQPGRSRGVSLYDATGLRHAGQPLVEAHVLAFHGAVDKVVARVNQCAPLLATLTKRYGEGTSTLITGERVWLGARSKLYVEPSDNGGCILTLVSVPVGGTTL